MKRVLAFGASSSKASINRTFAIYAANAMEDVEVEIIDLNDFEMPIFSVDRETENGIHPLAHRFKEHIKAADGILISFAEHNAAYSAAYKNIYDWASRIEKSFFYDKPLCLLATSPGARGGSRVLDIAFNAYSFANKNVVTRFSLPSFYENFKEGEGIVNFELKVGFFVELEKFKAAL
ncbi:NADPH-dependent FMN reductase [Arcticibacterium luteifluviistationis]|uniref:NADPH-dependent FMN reductase n=1 Tax=Arcticibacterium luteifluviistationis TaxID=1784714 RepID=A0A2Z4GH71_9BACT|nr:NAD(P)H-dependent oxidoreductase [Arcticibacterium luteifluviistationis]AWW00651.1 NADPH-dependent FMN reductase [Arcticibacterium luteifluviistationis]